MSKRKAARTFKARSASKIRSKAAGSGQPTGQANSKQAWVLALLCGPSGATIATVTRSTGWQPHTVRAFLAAVVRKRFGDGVVHPILGGLHLRYRKNPVFGSDNMVVEDALPPEQTSLRPFGLGARTSL